MDSGNQRPFTGIFPWRVLNFSSVKRLASGPDHDHAARCFLAVVQRLHRERRPDFRNFQRHRGAGVVVHVPEIGADRHRHRDAVAFVVRRAGSVAVGHARKVIADHLLIVFEAAAGQHHALAGLDSDRLFPALGPHAENFLGDVVLDQFSAGRFVENGDRALLDQPLEQFPGVGIAIRRTIMEFMHTVRRRADPETRCRPADADAPADRRRGFRATHCFGTSPPPRPSPWSPARCRVRTAR